MNEKFMNLGVLLGPKVSDIFAQNPEIEEGIFNKIQKMESRPVVLTEEILRKLQKELPVATIIKSRIQKEEWSIQDIINKYNERYNELQKILAKKIELKNTISINRATYGEVSIIGMVKNKAENTIELEDTTGAIKVVFKSEEKKIELDDVIAVHGTIKDKTLYADLVLWPDVPLKEVKKSTGKAVFISGFTFDKIPEQIKDADYIILINCSGIEHIIGIPAQIITTQKLQGTTTITNPCLIEISGVVILTYFGENNPADIIRKRYIDDFVVTPEPDIIFAPRDGEIKNYKGITIISANAEVDLKTRETKTIVLE